MAMKRAESCQNFVAFFGNAEIMSKHRKPRISIGLHMPGWLPRQLHTPVRVALGLFLGLCFTGYAVALATVVHRLLDLKSDPVVQFANLGLLIVGAFVLRAALIRWSRGFGSES